MRNSRDLSLSLGPQLEMNVGALEAILDNLRPGKPKKLTGNNGLSCIVTAANNGEISHSALTGGQPGATSSPGQTEMLWARNLASTYGTRYRMVSIEHSDRRVLHSVDSQTREVRTTDQEAVCADMRNYIGPDLTYNDANAAVNRTMDLLRSDHTWLIKEAQIDPLLFENQSPERYCYRRLPITQEALTICPPAFQELLTRTSQEGAQALALWLGSLLDASSNRSQYLVLYGEGNNGKSTLVDALTAVLGNAAISMSSSDFSNRFGLGDAGSARLLAFDDNNNASFMTTGEFKRVTGSKTLKVERKGKDAYRTRNNLKILIACNRLPALTGDTADMRRNILVKIGKFEKQGGTPGADGDWVRRLHDEMPDVLRYCYTAWVAYRGSHPGSDLVPTPSDTVEDVYNASIAAQADDFIAEHLEITPVGRLQPCVLTSMLNDNVKNYKVHDFVKHTLQDRFKVKKEGGKRYHIGVKCRELTRIDPQ